MLDPDLAQLDVVLGVELDDQRRALGVAAELVGHRLAGLVADVVAGQGRRDLHLVLGRRRQRRVHLGVVLEAPAGVGQVALDRLGIEGVSPCLTRRARGEPSQISATATPLSKSKTTRASLPRSWAIALIRRNSPAMSVTSSTRSARVNRADRAVGDVRQRPDDRDHDHQLEHGHPALGGAGIARRCRRPGHQLTRSGSLVVLACHDAMSLASSDAARLAVRRRTTRRRTRPCSRPDPRRGTSSRRGCPTDP